MQTFLPYSDFTASAQVLDDKRLGKQRVEAKQIILALTLPEYGWKHHPATKLWEGKVHDLACYAIAMCKEWKRRGFQDSLEPFFQEYVDPTLDFTTGRYCGWQLHESHQANLVWKDYWHYSSSFPLFSNLIEKPEYFWTDTEEAHV